MPETVELSVSIGVGGCLWTYYLSVVHIGVVVCSLRKSAPSLDYAADSTA